MKDRALTFISLALSLVALSYAAWVHQHSEQMATQALQRREREFVHAFAPKIQAVYEGLGVTNVVSNAQTLDDLFRPYVDVFNRMASPPVKEEKKP